MKSGILLVAHGRQSYWDEAVTLAKSLRRHSPAVPLAIASDLGVPEPEWRSKGFDAFVPFDFRACRGVSFKMQLDRITPFSDATLFLDSDSICYSDVGGAFDAFSSCDFVTLGMMLPGCHWFEDSAAVRRQFGCDSFPFFCGDFYLFRRSAIAQSVFETARDIASRFRSLGIKPLGGFCNDEPAFALAMTTHRVPVCQGVGEWILQVAHARVTRVALNYTAGVARAVVDGQTVSPRLIHFSAHRSQPLYFQERYRVRHPSPALMTQAFAGIVGFVQSVHYRLRRRLGA